MSPVCRSLVFCCSAALFACTSYRPSPLDTDALLAGIRAVRPSPEPQDGLDLATAAIWLSDSSPIVRESIARFRSRAARAKVSAAWPDPEIRFGPQWASGSALDGAKLTAFADLSLRIPLGARIAAAQDLDSARAEVARLDAILALREEQLLLRSDWTLAALARQRSGLAHDLETLAQRSVQLGEAMVQAGGFAAGELEALRVEAATRSADVYGEELAQVERDRALALRLGVDVARVERLRGDLPQAPSETPDAASLAGLAAAHRPALIRLRGEYQLAERRLRLEIEKQWPDLVLAPSLSDEPGEDKSVFALGIGLSLPLFDRNAKGVAEADAERDEYRERYATELRRTLTVLDGDLAAIASARRRQASIEDGLLPAATRAVELARRTADAGSGDALHLLDAMRSLARARFAALDARTATLRAWFALEQDVGVPLLVFDPSPPPAALPVVLQTPVSDHTARAVAPATVPAAEERR